MSRSCEGLCEGTLSTYGRNGRTSAATNSPLGFSDLWMSEMMVRGVSHLSNKLRALMRS